MLLSQTLDTRWTLDEILNWHALVSFHINSFQNTTSECCLMSRWYWNGNYTVRASWHARNTSHYIFWCVPQLVRYALAGFENLLRALAKRAKDPALRCSTADINTLPIAHLSLVSPSFTLCHSRQWFCGTYSCSHPDLQPRLVCQVVLISLLFTYYYPHTRAYCKARLLTFIASPYIRKLVSATTNYHYSQISY